jgi:uncharacterized protein
MELITLITVFAGAIVIGVFAVVMGGTLFLSLPLFQLLFPEMSLGAMIGNIKLGSILRNATALLPLYRKLNPDVLWLAPVLCLGSVIGSWQIVSVSHTMVPIVLLLGFLVHEYGKRLRLPYSLYWVVVFLVGFYGGIFGAGIMLLLLALLQLRELPLVDARANALLLELLVSAVAVLTFWHFDLINWPLALVWASGGMIGGLIGGILIKYSRQWSPTTQHWLVRIAFLIALTVAVERLA